MAVFTLIWLNFVLEMVVNIIFTPVIYRVIKVVDKKLVIKAEQQKPSDLVDENSLPVTEDKEQ